MKQVEILTRRHYPKKDSQGKGNKGKGSLTPEGEDDPVEWTRKNIMFISVYCNALSYMYLRLQALLKGILSIGIKIRRPILGFIIYKWQCDGIGVKSYQSVPECFGLSALKYLST